MVDLTATVPPTISLFALWTDLNYQTSPPKSLSTPTLKAFVVCTLFFPPLRSLLLGFLELLKKKSARCQRKVSKLSLSVTPQTYSLMQRIY